MNTIKYVCLCFYIIVLVLFIVGYVSQSIISAKQIITMPINDDGSVTTSSASEVLNFTSLMISSNGKSSIDYSNANSISTIIFKILFALCIIITILLSLGVLLSILNKILISKIILLIVLILMLILFILLIIVYLTINISSIGTNYLSSFLTNYITTIITQNIQKIQLPQGIPTTILNNIIPSNLIPSINSNSTYDNGFILITISTWLMFINHIVYMFYVK